MAADLARVPSFYHKYINLVRETDLMKALKQSHADMMELLVSLPQQKWDYRYAPGKWSVKEVVLHISDAERIFCYRALSFARKDQTPLPGFDENLYAAESNASGRTPEQLIHEINTVHEATCSLFGSFNEEQLEQSGYANNNQVYVKGIGFIIAGHKRHHVEVMIDKYEVRSTKNEE